MDNLAPIYSYHLPRKEKMDIQKIFLILAAAAVIVNVVVLMVIVSSLNRRGMKTNIIDVRMRPWKYLAAYKAATVKETGKPGSLYTFSLLLSGLAIILALVGLLIPRS